MAIQTGLNVGINATQAQQGAAQFNAALASMAASATTTQGALSRVESSFSSLNRGIFNFRNVLATIGFVDFAKSVVDAQVQMNQITTALEISTKSATAAGVEYDYVRGVVNRLGVDLPVAAKQFSQIAAAATNTSLEGLGVRKAFEGIVTAMTALHAPASATNNALYAVQEMISKGVVQSKELRRQLGNELPGAFQIAAQAMGVTTVKLSDMMRKNQVIAETFLPKFADALIARFGDAAAIASNQTQALLNKLSNAWFEFKANIAQGSVFGDKFNQSLRDVTQYLSSGEIKDAARQIGDALAEAMRIGVAGFKLLADHATTVLHIFEAYLGLRLASFFITTAGAVKELTTSLIGLAAVQSTQGFIGQAASGVSGLFTGPQKSGVASSLFTKSGTFLNYSQLKTKLAATSDPKEFDALVKGWNELGVLFGKNGQLLSQVQLNAKAAGYAFDSLSFSTKKSVQAFAEMFGLQLSLSNASKLSATGIKTMAQEVLFATGTFLQMVFTKPATVIMNLAEAATTAGRALLGLVGTIPVWGQIAIAVAAVIGTLYELRDTLLSFGGHTAKLKSYFAVAFDVIKETAKSGWDSFTSGAKVAWDFIKDPVVKGITETWTELGNVLRTPWDNLKTYLGGTWLGSVKNSVTSFFSIWAASAEALENTAKATAAQGKTTGFIDPITGKQMFAGVPGPPQDLINAQYAQALRNMPKPPDIPDKSKTKIDHYKEEIEKLQSDIKYTNELTQAYMKNADAVDDLIGKRKAMDEVIRLHLDPNSKDPKVRAKISNLTDLFVDQQNADKELSGAKALKKVMEDQNGDADAANVALNRQLLLIREGITAKQSDSVATRVQNDLNKIKVELTDSQIAAYVKMDTVRQTALKQQETERVYLDDINKRMLANLAPRTVYQQGLDDLNKELQLAGDKFLPAYRQGLKDLDEEYQHSVDIMLEKSNKWTDGLQLGMRQVINSMRGMTIQIKDEFVKFYGQLEQQIAQFTVTGKFQFASLFESLVQDINTFIIRNMFSKLFQTLLAAGGNNSGGFFGTIGSILGGVLGKVFLPSVSVASTVGITPLPSLPPITNVSPTGPAFAMGGVMSSYGSIPLHRYSTGGVATSPQLAQFGEGRLPEAYVPLQDGRSIPVTMRSSGSDKEAPAPSVKVYVLNKSGSPVGAQQGQTRYNSTLRELVTQIILTDNTENGAIRRSGIGR